MLIPLLPMRILLVLIGISLGAVVTPATLNGMATYPLSIAVLFVTMVCISVSGAAYLRVVHGWDKITAYLAAAPGGLSQVMGLAAELDADMRAIAIVQTVRVVIIAVGLPAGLSLLGLLRHAHFGGAAWQRIHSCGDAVVGGQHGDDRVWRGYGIAFRRHAVAAVGGLYRRRLRLVRRGGGGHGGIRGRIGRRVGIADRRGDDRLRARRGGRHDAARARAQSRPGLCRRASSRAHLLRIAGHAAAGAPRRARAQGGGRSHAAAEAAAV